MELQGDELLISIAACVLPILAIGLIWWLARRFVGTRCPQCRAAALTKAQDFPAFPPFFAFYGCRKCGKTGIKLFRL